MKALLPIAVLIAGAANSAVHAQSGEILFCDEQHPNYAECQRQLERQQRGAAERRDIETARGQQIFLGLDPVNSKCNTASPSYNECERQRIIAIRNYQWPQPRSPLPVIMIPRVPVRCDSQKPLYAECQAERQRYEREMNAIAEANKAGAKAYSESAKSIPRTAPSSDVLRQMQNEDAIRRGTREGVRDALRGY